MDRQGGTRQGTAGMEVLGNAGKAGLGKARHSTVMQAMQMTTGKDPWQPGKTGYILTTTKGTTN